MKGNTFTPADVQKIARLAKIPIFDDEALRLAEGFTSTMKVVDALTKVHVNGVTPTSQVTGFENVFREDDIDATRIFTQEIALASAVRTYNGFFVVDQVLTEK